METPRELFSVQFKVASGTETISGVQLIDESGRLVPFDPMGNASGTITITTSWQSFEELWLAAVRTTNKEISQEDYRKHMRLETYRVGAIAPVRLSGLTVGIQVRTGELVSGTLRTFNNGDWFWFGQLPYFLVPGAMEKAENQVIGVHGRTVSQALTTDTGAHVAGDVVVANVALTNLMRAADKTGYLSHFVLRELDNSATISGQNLWVYFLRNNHDVGAANAPFAPSDAEAQDIMHSFLIETTDWIQLGSLNRMVAIPLSDQRMGALLVPKAGTRDVYIAMETDGAVTPGSAAALHVDVAVIDA